MYKPRSRISSFSVIVMFVCMTIIGATLVPLLSIQLYPSKEGRALNVSYAWPNVSARVMEQEVSAKLEGMFASVKGVQGIYSVSSKGYGRINLTFKEDINLDAVRFEIASLIRQIYPELPADVSYPQVSMSASGEQVSPLITLSVNASASPLFISKYVEKAIIPPLSRIEGVNDVRLYGVTPYETEVTFKMQTIEALGISGEDIAGAINRHFRKDVVGRGTYRQNGQDHFRELSLALRYTLSDTLIWEQIPVRKTGERVLYLKDLAEVRYQEQTPSSYHRINGLNTINIVIYPEKGVNNILLAKTIREEMQRIRGELQAGYSVLLANDSTEYLVGEINKIVLRAALSSAILLAFVFAVSREWRYLLLIALTLVINLLISAICFYLCDINLELYSLAGLTISLGIMIDNSIIMIDHLRKRGDKNIMISIVAATFTTIAALVVIFFLPEEDKGNLIHFSWVIIISLSVSMFVAYLFIPAMMERLNLHASSGGKRYYRRRRLITRFTYRYGRSIFFLRRFKWLPIGLFIIGFGVPVHWLPEKVESETIWAEVYNESIAKSWLLGDARPVLEKILGGTLRLFTVYVFESSYYPEPGKTVLHVNGIMPEGCTVQQLNEAIEEMENFISEFEEVELFQTTVSSYRSSAIEIHFKPEHEWTSFPYLLKSELESKAINVGGADWRVYGVGQGFSNAIHEGYKSNRILLTGYNYEQLYKYAELLKENLLHNPRIKEVDIFAGTYGASIMHEYFISFDEGKMAASGISHASVYGTLRDRTDRRALNPVYSGDDMQPVYLASDTYGSFNVWDFNYAPVQAGEKIFRLGEFAYIKKRRSGNDIMKYNQEYQLTVHYDFVGSFQLSELVRNRHIDELKEVLPLGFSVQLQEYVGWNKETRAQYYLILLVIVSIYFICVILLESLRQPLAIIAMIPISFIGVFLTFYLFDLNFDQGGFASFILLSGLTVNAALYILNDYNSLRKASRRNSIRVYLSAYNHKIVPAMLTILSTILGLVPFVMEGQKEVFWFAFASGTIGGLVFSMVGILFYLPLFIKDLK